jgi:uncharacterized protein (TIGR03084 family)
VVHYRALLEDLAAEETSLDELVAPLDEDGWRTATPAAGWDVRDGIGHLCWSEELASTALNDADEFARRLQALAASIGASGDSMTARARTMTGSDVLAWWREVRGDTLGGLRSREPKDRIPWIAGPMSAMSFATARLMETWAHGQDIADGLGVARTPAARLRHVADLGVRTRRHAFLNRGLEARDGDVRVELAAPDGSAWCWGESTTDSVRGTALDFCLVTTQRRNPADTGLVIDGPLAEEWMAIAQAFAGPPTEHRPAASPRS